ncbi:MAG TPA: HEAT repeat domain-containing protein, partial [Bacteroidales bacterium]
HGLRLYALQKLNIGNDSVKKSVEPLLVDMAKNDPKSLVRAGAIEALGRYKKEVYKPLFLESINDSSYSIAGKALVALGAIDTTAALDKARILSVQHVKGALADAITNILFTYANENDFDSLAARFDNLPFGNAKFMILQPFANFLKRVKNSANFMKGIDMIVRFRDTIPQHVRQQVEGYFNGMILNSIGISKQSRGMTEQADYVKSKLPVKTKTLAVSDLPRENLQKYAGEYDFNGTIAKVILKDDETLNLIFTDQPDMELTSISQGKFSLKYMEGYSIEFTSNEKGEVSELVFNSPDGQVKAPKKK